LIHKPIPARRRYYGLSNETTFGVCQWVQAADAAGCPRPVSIQNQFSLLYRPFEGELAEACAPANYNIALLPWTPLGGGLLSDKYLGPDGRLLAPDAFPPAARHGLYPKWMVRFVAPRAARAVERYAAIARDAGLPLASLALRWCLSRWFATSTIIGATSMDQVPPPGLPRPPFSTPRCSCRRVSGPQATDASPAVRSRKAFRDQPLPPLPGGAGAG
jgi:aryl-alcohol dehydrogenase-like predicted oxidoreductase